MGEELLKQKIFTILQNYWTVLRENFKNVPNVSKGVLEFNKKVIS